VVSACHRVDWSFGSLDRIPAGYSVVAFYKKTMHIKQVCTTALPCLPQRTLHPGGTWTRIFCYSGWCKNHCVTTPGRRGKILCRNSKFYVDKFVSAFQYTAIAPPCNPNLSFFSARSRRRKFWRGSRPTSTPSASSIATPRGRFHESVSAVIYEQNL
jgi:hypothetical protein